jgi:hypothetical protein
MTAHINSFHSGTLASNFFLHNRTFNSQLTGSPSLLSLPCRDQPNCQPWTNWFAANCLSYNHFAWAEWEIPFPTSLYCCRRVFTDLLPRNGLHHRYFVACMYVAAVTQEHRCLQSQLGNGVFTPQYVCVFCIFMFLDKSWEDKRVYTKYW